MTYMNTEFDANAITQTDNSSTKSNNFSLSNIDAPDNVKQIPNNIMRHATQFYLLQYLSPEKRERCCHIVNTCRVLSNKSGVHSPIAMYSAGFRYTGKGDTVHCDECGLEVSGWTLDMKPFTIHAQCRPDCSYVRSIIPDDTIVVPTTTNLLTTTSASDSDEKPPKRLKTEATYDICQPNILIEITMLKLIRKRTFSHWPHRTAPSSSQMVRAGFFSCNVGDRVICLYCNIICQQWVPNSDDPYETHRILSPKCPYVITMLRLQQSGSILIINNFSNNDPTSVASNTDPFRCNGIVYTAACHTAYIEIPRRLASFATWSNENLPSVDDLVRAGFFYTGTKTIVTCFYCNGSLQNWGANDNPTIEHVRWFPHCAYATQLCGAELCRKIQESKNAQQAKSGSNAPSRQSGVRASSMESGLLNIPDESTLSRFVAARLDLPISQSLLNQKFKLSIVKRCYGDQLKIKHNDFIHECDILVAVLILQKQIEHIDGKKENIIVPSSALKNIREREQAVIHALSTQGDSSNNADIEMSAAPLESVTSETDPPASATTGQQMTDLKTAVTDTPVKVPVDDIVPSNPCAVCFKEEKRLACIPCGHLATCAACGQSLRLCPICCREIDAFVRIYM